MKPPRFSVLSDLRQKIDLWLRARPEPPQDTGNAGTRRSLKNTDPWPESGVLMHWTLSDPLLCRDAYEHFLITGRTGSGKSTTTGRLLAKSFLQHGWGGLVLCAKPSEKDTWLRYAQAANRLHDVVVFSLSDPWHFDPLAFECSREGAGAAQTESLVALFEEIVQASERTGGSSGRGDHDESFWRRTLRQLLRNLIDTLLLSGQRVSVPGLCRVLFSAPQTTAEYDSESWRQRSFLYQLLRAADAASLCERERNDLEATVAYWANDFPQLSEKTRSIICTSFTSAADALGRGSLRTLFGRGESNLTPKAVEEGKIIVVDVSAKEFGALGVIAGVIWKTAFMRSIERRDVVSSPRPCFLWMDEAQTYVTAGDAQFISTCRSARVSVCMLTQNLPVFVDALGGGEKGRAAADALFSNLCTRVHHCSGCPVTNKWVSDSIGNRRDLFGQFSSSQSQDALGDLTGWGAGTAGGGGGSFGFSEQLKPQVDISDFTSLRTGGAPDFIADAIVVRTGRLFAATGCTWAQIAFPQRD